MHAPQPRPRAAFTYLFVDGRGIVKTVGWQHEGGSEKRRKVYRQVSGSGRRVQESSIFTAANWVEHTSGLRFGGARGRAESARKGGEFVTMWRLDGRGARLRFNSHAGRVPRVTVLRRGCAPGSGVRAPYPIPRP